MKVQQTVLTTQPLAKVFDYLSDFTTTTDWDPGTVSTVREHGTGGIGTTYLNTSRFLGRQTHLRYTVHDLIPHQRIQLRGENNTVISTDTLTFRTTGSQTEVTYTAEFTFKGPARYLTPLLRPALTRLASQAGTGLRQALSRL